MTRAPNLAPEFIKDFSGKLGLTFIQNGTGDLKKTFGPEDVFHYIYAVFHSPTYRTRYAEFLKIDFPRVPLTSDVKLFRKLVASVRSWSICI
jgi:predicted helicase